MVTVKVTSEYDVGVIGDVVIREVGLEELAHRVHRIIMLAVVVDVDYVCLCCALHDFGAGDVRGVEVDLLIGISRDVSVH